MTRAPCRNEKIDMWHMRVKNIVNALVATCSEGMQLLVACVGSEIEAS